MYLKYLHFKVLKPTVAFVETVYLNYYHLEYFGRDYKHLNLISYLFILKQKQMTKSKYVFLEIRYLGNNKNIEMSFFSAFLNKNRISTNKVFYSKHSIRKVFFEANSICPLKEDFYKKLSKNNLAFILQM